MTNYHIGTCLLCEQSSDIELTEEQLNRVLIWQKYRYSNKPVHVSVPGQGFTAFPGGPMIQQILPELTAGQREQIMSGSHENCFDGFFPEDEDIPPHVWDGAQWTCMECGHQSPDPCDCDCHGEGTSDHATETARAEPHSQE